MYLLLSKRDAYTIYGSYQYVEEVCGEKLEFYTAKSLEELQNIIACNIAEYPDANYYHAIFSGWPGLIAFFDTHRISELETSKSVQSVLLCFDTNLSITEFCDRIRIKIEYILENNRKADEAAKAIKELLEKDREKQRKLELFHRLREELEL